MHCMTASEIKSGRVHHCSRDVPAEGSTIRAVFDTLQANKGVPVAIRIPCWMRVQFTDMYGLDVRQLQKGHSRTGRETLWLLAGEWFGKVYIDYVAERLERAA